MKKITKCILCFFIIFTADIISVYADGNLNLESDSYNNETDSSYMSVLDIYKVKLFNNKTCAKKEEIKEENKKERQALADGIFLADNTKESDDEFTEKVENYKLFSKVKTKEKIKYTSIKTNNMSFIIAVIIGLCLATGVITRIYYVKKNKGEEGKVEYNNYIRL